VGFAGSMLKVKACTGWHSISRYGVCLNYVQRQKSHDTGAVEDVMCVSNPKNLSYSPVVPLDGMCQFVRKDVWNKVRFDQEFLKGFHCYDVDFSIAVSVAGYRNWVCHQVLIKHMSFGGYSTEWYDENVRMHKKWEGVLPLYAVDELTPFRKRRYEFLAEVELMRFMIARGLVRKCKPVYIWYYWATHMFNRKAYDLLRKYYGKQENE
jgi:GT2 family glycosyltransferase